MSGAIEVKYNLPIELTDRLSLNTQLRFREMYDTEQYRVTFGGKYKIGNKNSLYASAHYTQKSDGSKNYGGWLGWSHGPRDEELQINNDGTVEQENMVLSPGSYNVLLVCNSNSESYIIPLVINEKCEYELKIDFADMENTEVEEYRDRRTQ